MSAATHSQMRAFKTGSGRSAFRPRTVQRRSCRPKVLVEANISFAGAPPEVLVIGGAFIAGTAGYLLYEVMKAAKQTQPEGLTNPTSFKDPELPRKDAVVVFGASGRSGREIISGLLASNRTVIAAVRSKERTVEAFSGLGIVQGRQSNGSEGILFIEEGIDVTDPATLTADVFKGATQAISSIGAVFGRSADGTMGYLDGLTPEKVDAEGNKNIVAAASKYFAKPSVSTEDILPMKSPDDLSVWQRLDDVIMGGQSSSGLAAAKDGSGAIWSGTLVLEGGGFCGARTAVMKRDLSSFDGILLRVKGDGQTFKMNIKTDMQTDVPEDTYQATFDTIDGQWCDVYIPWHEFVLVKRAKTVPGGGPALDPSKICQFGFVLSRFEFNGFANPRHRPGAFELHINGGITAFKQPKPQIILISSAGVERNAKIGDDLEARKKDIPIVQLNPGAILNHKYTGENAVRASGLSYAVIRPVGLTNETDGGPFLLEAKQGDCISGKISRSELAATVTAAADMSAAVNKTVEIRRIESADAKEKSMNFPADFRRMFLTGAAEDRLRTRFGLEPFPAPATPTAPVSEERKKEILSDSRVQQSIAAGRGGRVRSEEETAEATMVTVTDDGREGTSAPLENVQEAREWIRNWRAKNLEKQLPKEENATLRE